MGDTPTPPEVLEAFASGADAFARLDEPVWDPVSRATILRTQPAPGERVFDACAGDGASAIPTAELVGPEGHVDAVDLSEPLIAMLRERAGERMPQLAAHVGDVLEWDEDGYDLVQCVLAVFFFDDLVEGARRLVSRARPGGRVGFTVWARGAWEPIQAALRTAVGVEPPEPSAAAALQSSGAFARWLHDEVGLEQVRAEQVPLRIPLDDETAWAFATGTGMRALLDGLDDEELERVRERYLAELADVPELAAAVIIGVGVRPSVESSVE